MAWVKLEQEKHVLPRLNDFEMRSYDDAADSAPLYNKVPAIIEQVVSRVRGAIQSCNNNKLFGEAGTIPEECVFHAVSLVRQALIASNANSDEIQGEVRTVEAQQAEEYLQRVALCQESIVPPGGESGQTTGTGIYWGSNRKLDFSL